MFSHGPAPWHVREGPCLLTLVVLLTLRRELGVVEHFVTECVPAYYAAKWDTKEACKRELERLSERVRRLTAQLPDNETVFGIFLKGGSKTGPQFRSAT